jgi:hypothetical protein
VSLSKLTAFVLAEEDDVVFVIDEHAVVRACSDVFDSKECVRGEVFLGIPIWFPVLLEAFWFIPIVADILWAWSSKLAVVIPTPRITSVLTGKSHCVTLSYLNKRNLHTPLIVEFLKILHYFGPRWLIYLICYRLY